jgi:hypothetical protein
MSEHKINPEKITKPIQLLAAWLIGLIVLVGSLVTAANLVTSPTWLPVLFSIAAIAIIPLFLYLIFQLQTKYRPQMQEDQYYSQYLNNNTNEIEYEVDEKLIQLINKNFNDRILKLAEVQEKQLLELNKRINLLLPESKSSEVKITSVRTDIINSSSTLVFLNQKIENYEKVRNVVKSLKISIFDFFGDMPESSKLDMFLLSFGSEVEIEILKKLIPNLLKYGLTHIRIVEENHKKNNLYIGSYAYKEENDEPTQILKLSDEVVKNINAFESTSDVYSYVSRNMI